MTQTTILAAAQTAATSSAVSVTAGSVPRSRCMWTWHRCRRGPFSRCTAPRPARHPGRTAGCGNPTMVINSPGTYNVKRGGTDASTSAPSRIPESHGLLDLHLQHGLVAHRRG